MAAEGSRASLVPLETSSSSGRAHPVFVLPILLVTIATYSGSQLVSQSLGNKFFGNEAGVYLNLPNLISGFAAFFVVPILGALSDRWGRKPVLLLPLLGLAAPWLLLWIFNLAQDGDRFKLFLAAKSTFGALGDMPGVMGMCFSYVADCVPAERRGAVGGMLMAFGSGLGFVVGPLLFSKLFQEGAQTVLAVQAAVALMLGEVVYATFIPESHTAQRSGTVPAGVASPLKSFRLLFGEASAVRNLLRRCFAIMFLCYLVKVGLTTTLGIFAMQVYQFTATQSGTLSMVYGVVQSLSQLSLPLVLRFASRRSCICFGLFCGFVSAAVPTIPGAPAWSLFLCEAMLAVPYIVYTLLTTMAANVVPPNKAGEASMMVTAALTLSSAVGPLTFGALSSASVASSYPGSAFLLFTAVMLTALALGVCLPRESSLELLHQQAVAAGKTDTTAAEV